MRSLVGISLILLTRLITGAIAHWRGCLPGQGQRIYCANHRSHLDTLIIWSALPSEERRRTRPVAAADYWLASPLRRYIATKVLRCVLIPRRGFTGGEHNPIALMTDALDAGNSLILFPEGTRGDGTTLGRLHPGVVRVLQARSELPAVPVWLDQTERILPKGEWLPVPLLAAMHIGTPLHIDQDEARSHFLVRLKHGLLTAGGQDVE